MGLKISSVSREQEQYAWYCSLHNGIDGHTQGIDDKRSEQITNGHYQRMGGLQGNHFADKETYWQSKFYMKSINEETAVGQDGRCFYSWMVIG